MKASDDYCPVAKSVEVLGDRWCLLLVRELLRGVGRFNELERSVPGISRSVLAQRLRHLEREGVVDRRIGADGRSTDYRLTDAGYELGAVIGALNDWGVRWRIPDGGPPDLDPDGLMLWVRRHVVLDQLPTRRVVVGFRLRSRGRRSYWLVLQPGEVSLCPEHPASRSTSGSPPTPPPCTCSSWAGSGCPRPSTTAPCGSTARRRWSGPYPAGFACGPERRGRSRQNSLPSGSRRTCQRPPS
jgi:DNA-binding HxlR family transcriptional regulator